MIVATLTKVLAGVTLVGVVATTALLVFPHPGSHSGVWLDTPLDGAVVAAGEIPVVLHSDIDGITGIFVSVVLDGKTTMLLRDTELEQVRRGAGAEMLSVFDQQWNVSTPGVYTLDVSVSGSTATVRSFQVTVTEQGPVFVDSAEASPQPSATPEPTEAPAPLPTREPDEPSGPLVAASVERFQSGDDDWQSDFTLLGYSPGDATAMLEVRITDTLNDVVGEWQQYPCTTITAVTGEGDESRYTCEITNHRIAPPSSFQIDGTWMPFSVEYRSAVYSGDETEYGSGGSWETARRSAG